MHLGKGLGCVTNSSATDATNATAVYLQECECLMQDVSDNVLGMVHRSSVGKGDSKSCSDGGYFEKHCLRDDAGWREGGLG
jgi:hypothetical protein